MPSASRTIYRAGTAAGTQLRVRYADADKWAEFVIDEHGRRVLAARSQDILLDDVGELLLGQVFSCLLAQRGITCLHASVVELDGRALALVAASGGGKSTTALALLQRGAALLSDDIAALRERDGRFTVSIGTRRVRLRADAARTLVGSFAMLDPIWAHEPALGEKRYLHATESNGANHGERTLDVVCLLRPTGAPGTKPHIRALTAAEALPRLMANRHMAEALDRDRHARDFERLARLAETVPILELTRPTGLDSIQQTVTAIETGVQQLC